MRPRRSRPLFIIDIARAARRRSQPSAISSRSSSTTSTTSRRSSRRTWRGGGASSTRAEAIVDEEVARFAAWLQSREIIPTVVALRAAVRGDPPGGAARGSSRSWPACRPRPGPGSTRSPSLLVEKLLLTPTEQLKSVRDDSLISAYSEALNRLFALDGRCAGAVGRRSRRARVSPLRRDRRTGRCIPRCESARAAASSRCGRRGPWRRDSSRTASPPRSCVIRTSGDRLQSAPMSEVGGKRLFVKEIEDALLAGDVDVAVHSAKDMPALLPDGLTIAAALPREDPRDAFVMPDGERPDDVAAALNDPDDAARSAPAASGASRSCDRISPAAVFLPIRGNVDTRLRKLDAGEFDALVLAAAGLRRLGFGERISAAISARRVRAGAGSGHRRDRDPRRRPRQPAGAGTHARPGGRSGPRRGTGSGRRPRRRLPAAARRPGDGAWRTDGAARGGLFP